MWTILAFISALCLGCYDISKKVALRDNRVMDVLTISICVSAMILSIPLIASRIAPGMMSDSIFLVPRLDATGHAYTALKSVIVLSSWVFAYLSLKHLPISLVSPMQATRPMWTLIGALLLFGERLNSWQWTGVLLTMGTILIYSMASIRSTKDRSFRAEGKYYVALVLAILIGAGSGLYDKYLMGHYDHNAVQVYYTYYQALMMIIWWGMDRVLERRRRSDEKKPRRSPIRHPKVILLISIFLIISDNVYMLALQDPDSMISIVSTIRRGGAVIGFAYGLLWLKEKDPRRKIACMIGVLAGLICLSIGTL